MSTKNFVSNDNATQLFTKVGQELDKKQDTLTFDIAPTEFSLNPVTSGGVYQREKLLDDYKLDKTDTMPAASADLEGTPVIYVGATTSTYTKGHIYECQEITPSTTPKTYEWVDIGASGGNFVGVRYHASLTDYPGYPCWEDLTTTEKAMYDISTGATINFVDDNTEEEQDVIGDTDISGIADGTLTGAVAGLNNKNKVIKFAWESSVETWTTQNLPSGYTLDDISFIVFVPINTDGRNSYPYTVLAELLKQNRYTTTNPMQHYWQSYNSYTPPTQHSGELLILLASNNSTSFKFYQKNWSTEIYLVLK